MTSFFYVNIFHYYSAVDAQSTIEGSVSVEKFSYGFRIDTLLMLELLGDYEEFAAAQF